MLELSQKLSLRRLFLSSANQSPSMRFNFAWSFVGDAIYAASQWAMIVVLAKLADPSTIGQFGLALAITAPIMMLTSLKLRSVLVTDAKYEYIFGDYLVLRLLTTILAFFLICIIALIGDYGRETAWIIVLVGLAKSFDSLSDIMHGYLQQQEHMKRIALARIIQGITQILALGIVFYQTEDIVWSILAWAIVSGLVTFFYDWPNVLWTKNLIQAMVKNAVSVDILQSRLNIYPRWDVAQLKNLTMLALPLGLAIMLGSLWTNIPRYFVSYYQDEHILGIFVAIASLMAVGGTIINALGQTTSPRLALLFSTQEYQSFNRLMFKLVILGCLLGIGTVFFILLFGSILLTFIYTPEYANYVDVFIWISIASGLQFAYVFFGTGIQAMRNFKVQLPIQIFSTSIVIVSCFMLVDTYGLLGATWSMLISNIFTAVAFIVCFFYVKKQYINKALFSNIQ